MKKLMTLAALVAACAPAFTAEVESSNTVGYQKITLTHGYNMVSPMFLSVGGATKTIPEIFAEATGWTAADTDVEADYISIWRDGGYKETYFFSSDADGAWTDTNDTFTETEDPLPENVGFWLYNQGQARTVTLLGEVSEQGITFNVLGGFNLIANPFAKPLPVKSIVATSGEFVGADTDTDADYISVWRNGGYDPAATYFVSTDADGAWTDTSDTFTETEDTIAPGEAFWLFHRGSSSVTISIPCP